MSTEVRTHTALHVLKGAVQRVLGAKWTTSTYVKEDHGRLVVRYERKPTPEELARISEEANRKITENAEVVQFEMERGEAMQHFGDSIYDLFPVPASVTILKLVNIPDWNVNCCVAKHVESTSDVGTISVDRARFRNSRREVEIEFHVESG
ncbi:MAG: alanyl-tRNA editing protein [Thaumarchaeota archaeon]|nr:alanyl-tRNA editing protein [Nitrososphaerota archaeon]